MTEAAHPLESAASPRLGRLARMLVVLQLLLAAYLVWRAAVLTPYSDELDWVVRWLDARAHGSLSTYLFAPHNLHRQPWTFGLIALDVEAFGGTNAPLILSATAAVAVMAWLLAREAAKAAPNGLGAPAAALALLLALMPGNLLDAATPICADYTHGAVFAVLAVVLAEGGERRGLSGRRLAALVAAVLGGLGDGSALAVWPVLAVGALRRRDWVWLTAVFAAGGAFVGLYASGQGATTRGDTATALHEPLRALRLALTVLALPWARLAIGWAWIGGVAVGAVGLAAVLIHGGRHADRSARVATGLILFSLGVAAMAGLGRAGAPDALDAPLRYAIMVTPLHVGVLVLLLPLASEVFRARRRTAQALAAAVLLLAAAQNAVMAVGVVRIGDAIRQTLVDFRAGRRDPQAAVFVHPDLAYADRVYAEFRRRDLFRRELHLKPPPPAR